MEKRTPLLEVRNITKYYGNVIALQDISMDVEAGEVHEGEKIASDPARLGCHHPLDRIGGHRWKVKPTLRRKVLPL